MMRYNAKTMPVVSLEEAISCPPPLIGDKKSTAQTFKMSGKTHGSGLMERKRESVLSRWTGRPTIQSFMNAIANKHNKMQEQQEKQMYVNLYRLGGHQRLQVGAQQNEDLKNSPVPQKQLQQNPNMQQLQKSSESEILLKRQPQHQQPQQANTCKVTTNGMLGPNLPGSNSEGKAARAESGLVPNKNRKQMFGNILDDILARSGEGREKIVVSRRKRALSKLIGSKATQSNAEHKSGETRTLCELQSPTSTKKNVNTNKQSDDRKTDETSIAKEHQKAAITGGMVSDGVEKQTLKHATLISSPQSNLASNMSSKFVTNAQSFVNNCEIVYQDNVRVDNKIRKSTPNSQCDAEKETNMENSESTQSVLIEQGKQFHSKLAAEHATAQQQTNYGYSDIEQQSLVIDQVSSNIEKSNIVQTELVINPRHFGAVCGEQGVNIKNINEIHCKDINEEVPINLFYDEAASCKSGVPCNLIADVKQASVASNANAVTKEQGNVNMPKGKDETKTAVTTKSLESSGKPVIKNYNIVDGQIKLPNSNNQGGEQQFNSHELEGRSIPLLSAVNLTLSVTQDKLAPENTKVKPIVTNGQRDDEQFNSDMSKNSGPLSPTSISGDLVIDVESEAESDIVSTRRAKKRESYLSMSSESSNEDDSGLSSGFNRNLVENLRSGVEKPDKEATKNSARLPRIESFLFAMDGLLAMAPEQSYLANNSIGAKQGKSEKKDVKLHESLKCKETDDESKIAIGMKRKHDNIDKNEEERRHTVRVTRSAYHREELVHQQQASNSNRKRRCFPQEPEGRNFKNTGSLPRQCQRSERQTKDQPRQSSRKKPPRATHKQLSGKQCGTRGKTESSRTSATRRQTENQRSAPRKNSNQTTHSTRHSPSKESKKTGVQYDFSKGGFEGNTRRVPLGNQRRLSGEIGQKDNVVLNTDEDVPSLLSMVSNEVLDITVAQKVIDDQEEHHKQGPKRKKTKRPKEWKLRKDKEIREKDQVKERDEFVPRVPCVFYYAGKCAKGATCAFKHEKIKELCRFYSGQGCDKNLDGMCPRLHDEFPCIFFHKAQNGCSSGPACKFSHASLTDETREMLEKHIKESEQRRKSLVNSTVMREDDSPVPQQNEPSMSCDLPTAINFHPQRSNETTPRGAALPTVSKPHDALNSTLITQSPSKPIVGRPMVKRLCSLATFKSSLTFPMAALGKVESPAEKHREKTETTLHTRTFLPGLFKER